ncbi:MAG: ornithine--oxo-acid transaminase [Candidatus Marinimicrobia bacterium]|nr:ornithine--oxo-acid transaminase [Candidatus Neomarinimicrobiota bacterium]OQC47834.1 MAG: Ornithine aminotransferase [Candidatus Marinimicrobia bacterium ADurb.Bin030]HNZ36279.1 ornithine--oxo-acid transaminase [Candidatus Neomarinimicrobiota bacterium]HOD38031.1 ornithine--oxo-acid transaminase [Candidatus Neomarinimicrobiota bacterium]HOG74801.1 ornithine--oxo-acid transaminase [Candidatus Neomarinimicrobiota bacterium]
MLRSQDYIKIEDQYGAHNYQPLDVVLTRGQGIWLEDVEGKKYMDFLAAYSAVNQGHCHPRLVKVMQEQCARLTLTSRAFRNDQWPLLAKELCELTGYEMVLPMNSGAEAVETAIKAARKWGYLYKGVARDKAEIIVCTGNFHGRTTTIISFSTDEQYKDGFGPLTPGFVAIEYGSIEELKRAINPNTVAFLVEPIQGESGVIVPPEGWLKASSEICRKNKVLLIADEIQSGLGRTGKLFACEHENVRPDVVIIGKALSGGMYPVSAVVASQEILGVFKPGDHGSTYGGNPLGSAIAREALKIIIDEKLPQKSAESGAYLMQKLNEIESPYIEQIRGKGLWVGIVLKPSAGGARHFCVALQERGILAKETHENVIRLAPPLNITRSELDQAIAILQEVLTQ